MTAYRPTTPPTVPRVIRQLVTARVNRRISQAAVAERIPVTQTTLSRWENGQREPSLRDLIAWCGILGLDLCAASPYADGDPLEELAAGGLS